MLDGISLTNEIAVIALDGHRFSGPKHSHRQAQLLYAVRGTISITTEIGTWIVPPTRAVWIPAGIEHETSSFAGIQFRSLLIATTAAQGLPQECMVVEVTPLLRELILRLVDLAENPGDHSRTDAVIGLVLSELSFQVAQPLSLPAPRHSELARLWTCCMDQTLDERSPCQVGFHAVRSKTGRPSSVILLRTRTPMRASVF